MNSHSKIGKLDKIRKFLNFWQFHYDHKIWDKFSHGKPPNETQAQHIIMLICAGVENVDWTVLDE